MGPSYGYKQEQWPPMAPAPRICRRAWFTVLPVRDAVIEGWLAGYLDDIVCMYEAAAVPTFVHAPALLILRADGHAAGMRQLCRFLFDVSQTRPLVGFAMRTRVTAVERAWRRLGATKTFDEGDGDGRWWLPAERGLAWLQRVYGRGNTI